MKVIPKNELITIISHTDCELLGVDTIKNLFEYYGDDYYKRDNFYSDWELVNENVERKRFLSSCKESNEQESLCDSDDCGEVDDNEMPVM